MAKTKSTTSAASAEKTKKTTSASTTSKKEVDNEQLKKLIEEIEKLKKQVNDTKKTNEALAEENKALKESALEPVVSTVDLEAVPASSTSEYVTIVHAIQLNNGLSTFLRVGDLEITMRNIGEKRTLTRQQFEMILGSYRHYFDMGFIALDSSELELAEAYGVDCYNPNDETQFTAKTIKALKTMSLDEIEKLYKGLSDSSKKKFLNYWLNKVYEKEEGFYDKVKMGQLDRLAETNIFAHIISNMD